MEAAVASMCNLVRQDEPQQLSGAATAIAHHGELVQGVFHDDDGQLHRGLVTLPLTKLRSSATFTRTESSALTTDPASKSKAAAAARLALKHLGGNLGGILSIRSAIAAGHGYGSSTADVVAAIRAVAAAHDVHLTPTRIAMLAVAAEQASDAIAFDDQAVLFAQREGRVLENFDGSLPPLLVVGFKANGGLPIDTLRLPPARYNSAEIQQFQVVRALVSRAVRYQDPYCAGRAATVSAQISQRHLPKQDFDRVIEIAWETGACGVQVAHSGSLIGVLFDLAGTNVQRLAERAAAAAQQAGFSDVQFYKINDEGASW
ncbi:MAG: GHMP family kinase ATP-binding protein [Mesorhizobium sp.]